MKQVSEAVHIQLATIITKGIMDLEIDILSALEKHVLGPKGPGKDNMLPIWTCLWLMILTYRETIDAWSDPQHEKKGLPTTSSAHVRHASHFILGTLSAIIATPLELAVRRHIQTFRKRQQTHAQDGNTQDGVHTVQSAHPPPLISRITKKIAKISSEATVTGKTC